MRQSLSMALAICLAMANAQTDSPPPAETTAAIRPAQLPPTFRIVAPQVICKAGGGDAATELPKQITISMQTPGGQQLTYRVRMSFEVLGGFRGQQHSLRLWDSVRRLEERMNKRDAGQITEKNQINVNNTELTAGVYYVFEIVGMDASGAESEPQNYTVTFSDGKIKRTNPDGSIIPDDVSFVLLGAPNTYANQDYVVVANPSFCAPRNDYTIAWSMPALEQAHSKYTSTPGNVLRIPVGILRVGETYVVESSLLAGNESQVLVYQSIKVNVLERGFQMRLEPDRITIGVGSPLRMRAQFVDADYSGLIPQIVWRCEMKADGATAAMAECPGFVAADGLEQTVEFVGQGEFVVQIAITLGAITSTRSCQITVNKDVIVRANVLKAPSSAVAAGSQLEIEMMIDHLVPRCYCEWTVVQEEGYAYFDESEIPAGLGNLTVFDKEGNFLSELVDYENATMSRELTLLIPARTDAWPGLAGDATYCFRLLCTCPVPISDTELDDLPAERANITSATDLVIHTNAAPAGHPLEVVPLRGIAMRTVFKLTTGVATDEASDYPLLYSFVYTVRLDGQPLSYTIGEYFENTVTSTQLPYATDGVATAYEVCDSRRACRTIDGPRVSVDRPTLDAEKLLEIGETIEAQMMRTEYDGAFRLATLTAISLRNAEQADGLAELAGTMRSAIAAQVERLEPMLRAKDGGDGGELYVAQAEVVNFIDHARKALRLTDPGDVNDQQILQQLLQLFDLMEEEELVKQATGSRRRRRRRQASDGGRAQTLDARAKINAQLDIIELLLRNGTEEYLRDVKLNLTRRVESWMSGLCTRDVTKSFDKDYVKFEVRSVTYQQIQHSNHSVPLSHKQTIRGATVNFNNSLIIAATPDTPYCIGKAWYAGDYVRPTAGEAPREIFQVVLMLASARNGAEPPKPIALVDASAAQGSNQLVAWLPLIGDEDAAQLHCQVLDAAAGWLAEACVPQPQVQGQFVQCQCNRLGYIRLVRKPAAVGTEIVTELAMTDATTVTTASTLAARPEAIRESTSAPPVVVSPEATTTNTTEPTLEATVETQPSATTEPPAIQPTQDVVPASTIRTEVTDVADTATNSSNTGYALAGGALLLGGGIIGGLYVYNRRNRPTQTPAEAASAANPMEAIVNELREPAPIVRYARFHDEQTMRGTPPATLETVFDGR